MKKYQSNITTRGEYMVYKYRVLYANGKSKIVAGRLNLVNESEKPEYKGYRVIA